MSMIQKLISSAVLFLLAFSTGLLLSNLGKPYNTTVFTFHKLISVGAVIITFVIIRNLVKSSEIKSIVVLSIIIAIVSTLVLFVSGALMSVGVGPYSLLKTIHTAAPIITGIVLIFTYILLWKKQ